MFCVVHIGIKIIKSIVHIKCIATTILHPFQSFVRIILREQNA